MLVEQGLAFYERSKIEAEKAVLEYAKQIPCVTLRPGVIYGPHGNLYPSRLGFPMGENKFLVIGNGKNQIPCVYVENLIEAIYAALTREIKSGEIYNIVDDTAITQNEYLKAIKETVNPALTIIHVPYTIALWLSKSSGFILSKIGKQTPLNEKYLYLCRKHIRYSSQKAKIQLDWHPSRDAKYTLGTTMEYHKARTRHPRCLDWKKLIKGLTLKNPVNVGIIGCGVIARTHLDILKKIGNVHIRALCDVNMDAAHKLAESLEDVNIYNDVEEMLSNEKLNVVHILIPPQMRKKIVETAARHKCHILLEKPMALTAADAGEMVKIARENNVQLCVGHNHLYDPPMIEARKLVAKGAAGEILHVESWYGFNLSANPNSRYMIPGAEKHWTMTMPGKLYQNLFPHPFSVLADIMGHPEEIRAATITGNVVKTMKSDELKVILKCNGKMGIITVSLAVNPRYQFLNIYGTKMCLFIDFLNKTLTVHSTPKMLPKAVSRALISLSTSRILVFSTVRNFLKVLTKRFTYFDGTEILIKEFYRCLESGDAMPVSGEDGLKSMEVMDEIWRQIEL